jgi:hypothetical protein
MAELSLEPYAIRQRWQLDSALGSQELKAIFGQYLNTLARLCDQAGPCLIGHIKGLILFPNGDYVRGSVVSPSQAADVAGHMPEGCTELTLDLNVLVYGLTADCLERLVQESTAELVSGKEKWLAIGTQPD